MARNFYITTVELFGVLVPGVLFLSALLLFPPVANELKSSGLAKIFLQEPSADLSEVKEFEPLVFYAIFLLLSYAIGSLLRLGSITFIGRLTEKCWGKWLSSCAKPLEKAIETFLADETLFKALKCASKVETKPKHGKHSSHKYAPLFPFASRLARVYSPAMRVEIERMETQMRFMAGLVWPLIVWTIVAPCRFLLSPWLVGVSIVVSLTGLCLVFWAFPTRRVREVIYTYHLALVALREEKLRLMKRESSRNREK